MLAVSPPLVHSGGPLPALRGALALGRHAAFFGDLLTARAHGTACVLSARGTMHDTAAAQAPETASVLCAAGNAGGAEAPGAQNGVPGKADAAAASSGASLLHPSLEVPFSAHGGAFTSLHTAGEYQALLRCEAFPLIDCATAALLLRALCARTMLHVLTAITPCARTATSRRQCQSARRRRGRAAARWTAASLRA